MYSFDLILIFLALIVSCQSAKILFFVPGGTFSHKNNIWPLVCSLADRGHEVTFLSSQEKSPEKCPGVRDLAPKPLVDLMSATYGIDRLKSRKDGTDTDLWDMCNTVSYMSCKTILQTNDPILKSVIEDKYYDLVVINAVFGECGYYVSHRLGAKYIISDSSTILPWFYDTFGLPGESSWIPDMSLKFSTFPLSLYERMKNAYTIIYWHYQRVYDLSPRLEKLYKDTFQVDSVPSLQELERNASLMLINSHHSLDFARPLPQFVIPVGGMQCFNSKKSKPIPQEFLDFIESGDSKGVIVIAFGSSIELATMPMEFRNMFFELFRKFSDYKFIWKWDGPIPDDTPKNLMGGKWLPQNELLGHPKIRAFITHAGSNSVIEATDKAVPIIVLPLFADQDFNAFRVEVHEVGVRLEAKYLDTQTLQDAVGKILNDPKYKKNMKRHSEMFKDRPQSPVETAVYWVEFALRHNDFSSLKQMNMNQTWYEKRLLDVYVFAIWLFFLLPLFILYSTYILYRFFRY